MAITTQGRAAGRRTLALYPETTTFATAEAGFAAGKRSMPVIDLDTSGLRTPAIDNESTRTSSYGRQPSGRGKKSQADGFSFGGYLEGARQADGTAAGASSDTVVAGPMAWILGCLSGSAPVVRAGSAIESSPAPSTSAFTATDENLTAGQLCCVNIGGRVYTRPVESVSSGYNFAIDYAAAPTAGTDFITPTVQGNLTELVQYLLQGEAISPGSAGGHQDLSFLGGAVNNFTLEETSVFEAARFSTQVRVANFTHNVIAAQTKPNPNIPRAEAGGEAYLVKFSETSGLALKILRVSVNIERSLGLDPDFPNEELAIGGYVPGDSDLTVSVHVHDNQALPTATNTSYGTGVNTWSELFTSDLRADSEWKLLVVFGAKRPGRGAAFWFPALVLEEDAEEVTIDSGGAQIAAQRLMFKPNDGLGSLSSLMYWALY